MYTSVFETIEHIQTRSHKGFNYVVKSSVFDGCAQMTLRFECNCTVFNTEKGVKKFIDEITG